MWKRIDTFNARVQGWAQGKWVVVLGILFVIATILNVGKPWGIAQLEAITHHAGTLDQTSYDADKAYEILTQQGEAGRRFYTRLLLTTELVFPAIYRTFNVLFIAFLWGRWLRPESRWRRLALLPFLGMAADYLENGLTLILLVAYPGRLDVVATVGSVVSSFKWVSNYVDYTLMLVGLLGLVIHRFSGRRRAGESTQAETQVHSRVEVTQ